MKISLQKGVMLYCYMEAHNDIFMTLQVIYIYSHTFVAIFTLNDSNVIVMTQFSMIVIVLLAHDHQRCLDLLLLLLHLTHHLQHGVNWRTALSWPGEEVEQGHL